MRSVTTAEGRVLPLRVSFSEAVSDNLVMAKRNLLRYVRLPQLLMFSTFQPIMLILLFNYVFGNAISGKAFEYIDFVLPGIFIQSVVFGSSQAAVGLVDDLSKGIMDRFRSLPMARSAVLGGRTLGDSVRNTFVVLLMLLVAVPLGFRFHHGVLLAICGLAMAVFVGFVFSWIQACLGLFVQDPEAMQAAGFVWVFPMVFASSAFVPTQTMPGWLQAFANNQPLSQAINAMRWLMQGTGIPGASKTSVWVALVWLVGLLVVFVPITITKYRRLQ